MIHNFKLTEGLIPRYARLLCDTVIPFHENVLNDRIEGIEPSHAIDNFKNAAALLRTGTKPENGDFYGMVFQDSDVAKWIEAAAYSLIIKPDVELEARIDELCDLIAAAQEEDGYLDTYFTLRRPDAKFTNLLEGHELYCAGHMMEASVSLYEATGNRKLLDVMQKNADLLYRHFITDGAEGYPGHPEVELALMRLWRASGNEKYKELVNISSMFAVWIRNITSRKSASVTGGSGETMPEISSISRAISPYGSSPTQSDIPSARSICTRRWRTLPPLRRNRN